MGYGFDHTFKDFDRFFVGFDKIMEKSTKFFDDSVKLATNYPPYNLKKIGDDKYVIELGVAGFAKQDLEITLEGDILSIKGNSETTEVDSEVLHQGLAARAFTRNFKLADNIEIKNAGLTNGVLRIMFDAIIPEHNKIKIDIEDGGK